MGPVHEEDKIRVTVGWQYRENHPTSPIFIKLSNLGMTENVNIKSLYLKRFILIYSLHL